MSSLTPSVLLLAVVLVGSAAAGDARQQLDAFSEGLDALSAQFEQTTIDESGRVTEESGGQLHFRKPDRFRWDYEDPFPQQMVADGEKLWHFDESLDQVTVRDQPAAGESPLMVLTRPELLDRFYRVEPGEDADVLTFVPLDGEIEFERASLHFRDGVPQMLELKDNFGQMTRIELDALERNPSLDDDLFRFEPPEGVDILEGY